MEKTFEQLLNEVLEISTVMDDIIKGFALMVRTVEEMERLAGMEDTEPELAVLAVVLEAVAEKVNALLGYIYALEDKEILEMLGAEVREAIQGKEQYLAVAVMLVGGAF
jgi:hypothetical protein